MGVTPVRSRREFQVGPSQAIHSDPRALDPLGQLADVDLILLGRVSLLRILLSVISVLSVVIRSSYLPESSPRLSAPARTCGRGRLARFSLPQRLAVWWVALPWPILPVPAVLLALCRVVVFLPLDEPLVHACQEWASGGGAPLQRKFVGAGCVRRFLRRTGTPGFQTVWDTTADGESVRIESEPVFRCPDGRHEDRKCWQLVELGIHGLNRWLVKC